MREYSTNIETQAGGALVESSAVSYEVRLSVRRLLVFVLMALVFVLAVRPVTDPDFWWHLRTGRFIFETRGIPHTDIFSSTFAGREWVAHEWLSEVLMYAVHVAFGYAGLVVCFSLVISAAMGFAYRRCAARGVHVYVAGVALLLGALAASPTWGVRPQMFTFLFASVFLFVLDDYAGDDKRRRAWWLVPLTALWANMHAGFAMGLALVALTIAGVFLDSLLSEEADQSLVSKLKSFWRRARMLVLVFAACVLSVSLNPAGVRLYLYPFETLTSRAMMKYINEWFSPDFHEMMFQPLAVLIFATFAAMALSRARVRPGKLLMLVATGYMALRSGRNVPFFVLVAMPLLAEHAWGWLTRQSWGARFTKPEKVEAGGQAALKAAINVVLLVAIPLSICFARVERVAAERTEDEKQNFPVAAVEFMRGRNLPQPIFNEYGWGGYMIWNLYPDYRVYIDGRADVYGDAYLEEFLKTHEGRAGWRVPLERERVRTVVVKPDVPLASLLRRDAGWRNVFEDEQAVIFVRE
ncbi:MAG TPA: hypothetical protein VLJ61_18245 [Pyrinomonadaceae bacterium]|nr:hypothetical protein [Pyrinomonadaceae bacterium]